MRRTNKKTNYLASSLSVANKLLRDRCWGDALDAYHSLLLSVPHLRELVAFNIGYILKKAPPGSLDAGLTNEVCKILNGEIAPVDYSVELASDDSTFIGKEKKSASESRSQNFISNTNISELNDLHFVLKNSFGIDKIYVVNLDRRPDRYIRFLREMNRHGLIAQRIDGVDAKYSDEARKLFDEFRQRPVNERRASSQHVTDDTMKRYKSQLSAGVFGYILSQRKVIVDAISNGYKRILVLDDDVFFCSDVINRLLSIAPQLPKSLKVLHLGASEYAVRDSNEFKNARFCNQNDLYRPLAGLTCGSFSVVYDQSVFSDLLEVIDEADGTFDNVALGYIYNRYPDQCLVVDPAVCIPDVGDSDIRPEARVQELHSRKMGWEFERYQDYVGAFRVSVLVNSLHTLRHIQSLSHLLPSNIFLNVYYHSDDGLRPVITGHQFKPRDAEVKKIWASSGFEMRAAVNELGVPNSDIVMLWPDNRLLDEESVMSVFANAMQIKNKISVAEGVINGVAYCLEAGQKPIIGKHSIIIPCYRSVDDIWATLKSALLQDANDFEVVVVNDNPANKLFCSELLLRLDAWILNENKPHLADKLILIDHKINRGASAARNTGFFRSSGEFISFLDDDDYFEPSRLSGIENTLGLAVSGVGACYCGYSGAWNGTQNMDRFPEGNLGDRVLSLRYGEHYMCTNTVSFLRTSFQSLGGFNESYARHQDLELMSRYFEHYEVAAVRKFLVRNRPNPVPETFVGNYKNLCVIKKDFIADMRHAIARRGMDFKDQVIEAHVRDISKRDKNLSEETINTIRIFLASMIDAV